MEIIIKIDQRSEQAKAVVEMLKTFDFVKIEKTRYNKATEEAISKAKSNKTSKISLEDFRKLLHS